MKTSFCKLKNDDCYFKEKLKELQERSNNSGYKKFPSLQSIIDVVKDECTTPRDLILISRVTEAIKKLGNFS